MERPDFHLVYRKSDVGSAKIKALRLWLTAITNEMEQKAGAKGL
jgi:hypothetical protein